jgi:hypothetical protein
MSPLQFQAELTVRLGRPVTVYQNGKNCIVQLADHPTEFAGPGFSLTIETLIAVELALADILVQSQAVTVH